MASLETIDDDCDRNGIILVKLDNPQEAQQYGIDEIPSLVYFEDTIPHLFEGNLGKQEEPCLKVLGQVFQNDFEKQIMHYLSINSLLQFLHQFLSRK